MLNTPLLRKRVSVIAATWILSMGGRRRTGDCANVCIVHIISGCLFDQHTSLLSRTCCWPLL